MSQNGYLDMELLRFTTAGSVDDGKSTLIGRLLYDSKSIFEDQYEAIERASKGKGEENVNLALLTDGLRDEREQGITIDVAYRYFSTPKRKFIIADTPGHIEYTRNMVTGASTANLAVILVDARNGVVEQTRRHSYIASLLQIPHVVFCVNKMDLVDFSESRFMEVKAELTEMSEKLGVLDAQFIPMSALKGDNVVNQSEAMNWYTGTPLLELLETIHIASDKNLEQGRFPVQTVIRPQSDEYHDFRGYAGRVAGGVLKVGDDITVMPTGRTSKIKSIHFGMEEVQEAFPPMSVAIQLEDDVDVSRGDMLVQTANAPKATQEIEAMICWLNPKPMVTGGKYALKHTTKEARCIIKDVQYKVDIATLGEAEDKNINVNDLAKVTIKTASPLFVDSYNTNRTTGSLILIDEASNVTVGAGMII